MGLAAQIRAAVAKVATVVDDVLITVTHEAFSSVTGDGVVTYATGVSRKGFYENKDIIVRWRTGEENVGGGMLMFVGNVAVDVRDRITLPDGTTPPIVDVLGVADPAGGTYYTQVTFGKPERGQSIT